MQQREAPALRLTAVSPEGSRCELLPRLYRFPRRDISDMYGLTVEDELVELGSGPGVSAYTRAKEGRPPSSAIAQDLPPSLVQVKSVLPKLNN